ncbi:hypothetical protein ACFLU5_03625 [Bacteroidota bacterium]
MKYIFLTGIILSNIVTTIAQESKTDVIVSLKNGSNFSGYIITDNKDKQFSIFVSDTDSLVIPFNQITSIMYIMKENNGKNKFKERIFNVSEFGILFGRVNSQASITSSMTAQTTFGYGFNQYIKTGIGAGFDQYDGTYTLPVFMSIRGDILNKKVSPVYFVNAGYAAAWGDNSDWQSWADVEGGKMFDGGLGIRVASIDGYNLLLSLGYKVQKTTYTQTDWQGEVSRITNRTYKRLRLSLGIGF